MILKKKSKSIKQIEEEIENYKIQNQILISEIYLELISNRIICKNSDNLSKKNGPNNN